MLALSLPADADLADDIGEKLFKRADDEVSVDFSHRDTVPDLLLSELPAMEASTVEEESVEDSVDVIIADDANAAVDEHVDVLDDEIVAEPLDERAARPTVRTLSDWMPPSKEVADDEADELADDQLAKAPGPSFDLPNVPLTRNNGSTIEFDPNMSFGPAAESEFELDDVDFDSVSDDVLPDEEFAFDDVADETYEDPIEDSAPVFQEPTNAVLPAAPFLLPGMPPKRKRRSIVRTLIGTTLGGVVGLSLGYVVLLFALGPDGDLLKIAKYVPSSMLPKSFGGTSTIVAGAATKPALASTPAPTQDATAPPVDVAADEKVADEKVADEKVADEEKIAADESPATDKVAADDQPPGDESANVQTGYVAEAKPPAESSPAAKPAADDRYGTEPSPLEEPAAEPIAEEKPQDKPAETVQLPPAPMPLEGPKITAEELATALEAGRTAQTGLTTGDLKDAAVRRTKGMSYAKLCDLAEDVTFIDPASPSAGSTGSLDGAARLFRETLSDPHTRSEVARISQIWINSPHRAHGGVFLAGKISGGQISGDVYEYELATDDGSKLTLLMKEPLDPVLEGSNRPIGIVGSIVDRPADQIAGYHGTAGRAIWVARSIPLD